MKTNKLTKAQLNKQLPHLFLPQTQAKSQSAALPSILKFFWFLLSMRGIPEQFSWHGLTHYPLLDLLWNCFGMIHFLQVSTGSGYHKLDFTPSCALFSRDDVTISVMLCFLSRYHKDHNSHEEHTSHCPAALGECTVPLTLIRPSSELSPCVLICGFFLHCAARILGILNSNGG